MKPVSHKPHDLTQLTPLEANKIISHFVQSVNPSLKLKEPAPKIRPSFAANDRHHVANDNVDISSMFGEVFEIAVSVPADYSGLKPNDFATHFSKNYRGLTVDLDGLASVIMLYAAASIGENDLTFEDMEKYRPILENGWDILAKAKRNGSAHVRNMATELDTAMKEFFAPLPGQRFLPTSKHGGIYER